MSAIYIKGKENKKLLDRYENLDLEEDAILRCIKKVINKNMNKMPVTYRQKGIDENVQLVLNRMIELGFVCKMDKLYRCYPIIGKIMGEFDEVEE